MKSLNRKFLNIEFLNKGLVFWLEKNLWKRTIVHCCKSLLPIHSQTTEKRSTGQQQERVWKDTVESAGFPWDHFNYVLSLMKGSGNSSNITDCSMTTLMDLKVKDSFTLHWLTGRRRNTGQQEERVWKDTVESTWFPWNHSNYVPSLNKGSDNNSNITDCSIITLVNSKVKDSLT